MTLEPGGRPGGEMKALIGVVLLIAGVWLFFDSVRFTTGYGGLISGAISGGRHGRMVETTSMGVVLVPLFAGLVALFFDARKMWAWWLTGLGVVILGVEVVSRFRPVMDIKATHLILLIVLVAGGLGLLLRAYVEERKARPQGGNDE